MRYRTLYWSAFGSLLLASPLFGQEFTGHVSDPSHAGVPKAAITVHNQLTNVDVATETTHTGDYTVPYLKPGVYTVSVEAPGFKTENKTDITLEVDKTATINFTLKVGSPAEEITVTADALLDKGKADIGEVVENQRITELPLNAGDPSTLAQLSAGVAWYGSKQYTRPFDQTQGALDINGGGEGNSVLMLDGVSNESPQGNAQVAYIPPISAVEEFKIITNPYDAQFGRGQGGVIDMTLKSGGNQLHGSVYEYYRRAWLDANYWSNDYYGLPKSAHKVDQYGAELDGPIVLPKLYNGRDRAFFLLQFENFIETEPNLVTTSVPLPGWINGDFSNLTNVGQGSELIYDPLTIAEDTNPTSPTYGLYARQPFASNIIPKNRISPTAQKILSYYPAPNFTPPSTQNPYSGNYVVSLPIHTIYRNVLGKVDYNLTSHDRVTLRFGYWERRGAQNTNGLSGPVGDVYPNGSRNETYALEEIHTFTPNLVLDFKAVATTYVQINLGGAQGFDQTTLGFPASTVSQYNGFNNYFPSIGLSGYSTLGNSGGNISPAHSLAMLPTLTWIKGRHSIHGGADVRFLQQTTSQVAGGANFSTGSSWTQNAYGYQASNIQSGNSIASFLLGTPDSGGVSINSTAYYSQHYYAPFVQDDWKFTNKLTLNLGVRWDLNGPQSERHNRGNYGFDTTTVNPVNSQVNQNAMPPGLQILGGPTFLGVNGNPRTFIPMVKTNVQPRIGFAYSVDNNTVVRGGYGMMYRNPIPGNNNLGFSSNTQYLSTFDGGIHQSGTTIDNPFPGGIVQPTGSSLGLETGLGQSQWFINPHYKTPRFELYSLGVERQFLKHDVINVTYSGSRSTRQDSSDNINHVSTAAISACNPALGGNPDICNSSSNNRSNPFYLVPAFQGSSYYSSPFIPTSAFTRALPAFSDITEYQLNEGRSWYNSLQVTGTHRMSDNLTLHGTWTYSKTMDSGGFADGNYRILSRTLDGNDVTHRVTLSGVYYLPVGRGRRFLGSSNRLVDAAIGGWELAALYIYETGHPWSFGGLDYMHNAKTPQRPDPRVPGSIRGANPCVGEWNLSNNTWSIVPYQVTKNLCSDVLPVANYVDFNFVSQPPMALSRTSSTRAFAFQTITTSTPTCRKTSIRRTGLPFNCAWMLSTC